MDAKHPLLSAGDATLRTVGTIKLWWDIIRGVMVLIILVVLFVALMRYHARWKSENAKVANSVCDKPHAHTSCSNSGKNCSTTNLVSCRLHLNGFTQQFATDFNEGKQPSAGDTVKVYYDPTDRSQALLAKDDMFDDHKTMMLWILVGIGVVVTISIVVQFVLRNNKIAQRVAGGAAVFDLATHM